MLSRVAERFYWTARYLERTENTARLINVYYQMILDMPNEVPMSSSLLINITGADQLYSKHYKKVTDRNVYRFMLANIDNPASIYSSIIQVRENTRVIRDQMPSEAWESINELYRFAKKRYESNTYHKTIFKDLKNIIFRCQQLTGLLAGTMSHGSGYQFVKIGRNLERADMTTRILDAGAMAAKQVSKELEPIRNRLWREILQTLSAYEMYRKNVKVRVVDERVIEYLLINKLFPRSVLHCIEEIEHCFLLLPRPKEASNKIKEAKEFLNEIVVVSNTTDKLHTYIDDLQVIIGELHTIIVLTWFEQ